MVKSLRISSNYLSAANAIHGKRARRRIVAYVESYDDVLFWRTVLSEYENETRYFEVMLPTRNTLSKGKKKAIMSMLNEGGGRDMIACVDADYDYLLQGITENSRAVIGCPYVFHTYVYAIENYQCYAPSLHNVCVMATLNDHHIFDFVWFMTRYSEIIYPLFVWNILLYRRHQFHDFTMSDMNVVIEMGKFSLADPQAALDKLQRKVDVRLAEVRRNHQGLRREYEALEKELVSLGVTPQTTYLYVQGHHLFDNVVAPLVGRVCERLRVERETEIRQKACHVTQRQNELSAYQHSQTDSSQMMKKSTGYFRSAPFRKLQDDIEAFLSGARYPNLGFTG